MEDSIKKLKTEIKKKVNRRKYTNVIERLTIEINSKEKSLVNISTVTGVLNWLAVLSIKEFGLELSEEPFWDLIRLQYGWENM